MIPGNPGQLRCQLADPTRGQMILRRWATVTSDGTPSGERATEHLNRAPVPPGLSRRVSQIVVTGDLLAGFAGGAEAGALDLAAIRGVGTARMERTA